MDEAYEYMVQGSARQRITIRTIVMHWAQRGCCDGEKSRMVEGKG